MTTAPRPRCWICNVVVSDSNAPRRPDGSVRLLLRDGNYHLVCITCADKENVE